jgi:hypothetical protein
MGMDKATPVEDRDYFFVRSEPSVVTASLTGRWDPVFSAVARPLRLGKCAPFSYSPSDADPWQRVKLGAVPSGSGGRSHVDRRMDTVFP